MRHPLSFLAIAALSAAVFILPHALTAADPIFSGPQPGEKTTGFKVIEIGGAADGTERDLILDNAGTPTVLVFVHTVERSLIPLLRVIEQYGVGRAGRIKTEMIFLAADRLAGEQRVRAVNGSLKLRARVGFSPDGAEGPGNFGLNKECLMTIVMAKDNVVTANFALVQPGIADAPKVIAALAKTCGDAEPPTVEALTAQQPGSARGRGEMMGTAKRAPLDLAKLDVGSEEGLRKSVAALKAEVEALRGELAAARGEPAAKPKEAFPGGPWSNLARSINGGPFTLLDPGASVSETGTGNTRAVTLIDLYPASDPAHPFRFMRLEVTQERRGYTAVHQVL